MMRSRPDILRDTELTDMINVMEKNKKTIPIMVEDPVRRIYKRILAFTFIITSSLYILVDLIFQVMILDKFCVNFNVKIYRFNQQSPQVILHPPLLHLK